MGVVYVHMWWWRLPPGAMFGRRRGASRRKDDNGQKAYQKNWREIIWKDKLDGRPFLRVMRQVRGLLFFSNV